MLRAARSGTCFRPTGWTARSPDSAPPPSAPPSPSSALSAWSGGSPLAVAVNLAYPIGDLLLLAWSSAAPRCSRPGNPRGACLPARLVVNAAGDTFNLLDKSVARSTASINALAWPIAILLLSHVGVVRPRGRATLRRERPPGFAPAGVGAAAGLAILFVGSLIRSARSPWVSHRHPPGRRHPAGALGARLRTSPRNATARP